MQLAAPVTASNASVRPFVSGRAKAVAAMRVKPARAVDDGASTSVEPATLAPSSGPTYFYRGSAYTEEEWQKAAASSELSAPVARTSAGAASSYSAGEDEVTGLGQLMAFSGPAPELINGRLAMLAFVAALGAELSSGESVLRQAAEEPTGVALAVVTFAVASLIPLLSTTRREAFGPFSPAAEMLNGRAAMLGFAALLCLEKLHGAALF